MQEINYHNCPIYQIPTGYIIYQLSNRHSQQFINYAVRIIYFAVVLYVFVVLLYLIYLKQLFTNLFSFHLQTKDSDLHVYAHSWFPNVGNPIHWYNIFHWQVLFRQVRATNKTTILLTHFFYNTILYWLANLAICLTFLYIASGKYFSLWKIPRIQLGYMHCFAHLIIS